VKKKLRTVVHFFDISVSESAENLSVTKVELLVGDNVFFSGGSSFDGMEGLTYGSYRVYVEYTYGENGEKTGCYMTAESVDVSDMGEIEDIVKGGAISNKYSGDMQVYNPTTGDYRSHRGVDIKTNGADNGAYSCIYGKVTEISSGGTVVITSADGRVVFKYQAMTDILVELGDTVSFGQRIGTIGSTLPEETAEDDHLHLELSIDGEEKDPEEFLG
jgi:murein DD-endopeptidase MepM/ murein hydrolase activator NlpD